MMRARWAVLGLTLCLSLAYATTPPVTQDIVSLPHLRDAEAIAHGIDPAHNQYAHEDCFIRWEGEDGAKIYENRTDCSDFLNLLLQHSYQITPDDLNRLTGRERPTASVWYQTILAGRGFEIVSTIGQIQPGDVIAVQFPPGEKDTGHIMLIAGEPRHREPTAPLVDATEQWELPIIDSSKSGHGLTDTRRQPDGTFATGVGEGILRLYSNPDGSIAGYAWSVLGRSKFQSRDVHKIVIGRIQVQRIHPDH
jgi:hypothetical protein